MSLLRSSKAAGGRGTVPRWHAKVRSIPSRPVRTTSTRRSLLLRLVIAGVGCALLVMVAIPSGTRLNTADEAGAAEEVWLKEEPSGFFASGSPRVASRTSGYDEKMAQYILDAAKHQAIDEFLSRLYNQSQPQAAQAAAKSAAAVGSAVPDAPGGVRANGPTRAANAEAIAANIAAFDATIAADPVLRTCSTLLDKLARDLAGAESVQALVLRLMPEFNIDRLPRERLQIGRCDLTLELKDGVLRRATRDGGEASAEELLSLPPAEAAAVKQLGAWLKALLSRLPGAVLPPALFNLEVLHPDDATHVSACDDVESEFGEKRPPHRFTAVNCYPRCAGATLLPIDRHSAFVEMRQLHSAFSRQRPWADGAEKTAWFIWQGSDGGDSVRVADFGDPKNWGGSGVLEVGSSDRLVFTGMKSLNISGRDSATWPETVRKANFLIALPTLGAAAGAQYNPAVRSALLSNAVLLRQWSEEGGGTPP